MIGTGEGVAIAGVCGTITAAILRFVPRRNSNNSGNPGNPINPKDFVSEKLCDERSKNLEGRIERLGGYMKEVKEEILVEIRKKK